MYDLLSYPSLSIFDSNNYLLGINPWLITGFTDAEGCFTCSIVKNRTSRFGYSLNLAFQVESHTRDLKLLLFKIILRSGLL